MNIRTIGTIFFLLAATVLLNAQTAPAPATGPSTRVTASGLKIEVLAEGDAVAEPGDRIWVHFEGRFQNGKVFESSYQDGEPIDIRLGDERLIAGWNEGLKGMRVGEKRRLIVPPDLGYGKTDHGPIPANSTLQFDIELVGLVKHPPQ